MKSRNLIVAFCVLAALIILPSLAWWTAGQYNAIHAEPRTAHMEQVKQALEDETLAVVTYPVPDGPLWPDEPCLRSLRYYPQAETMIARVTGIPENEAYEAVLYAREDAVCCNSWFDSPNYGVTTLVFEELPPEALARVERLDIRLGDQSSYSLWHYDLTGCGFAPSGAPPQEQEAPQ